MGVFTSLGGSTGGATSTASGWSSMSGAEQASTIAGGAGLVGGLIQSISAPFMYKRSRRHADLMADKAFSTNKKMWDLQNEYNKPINQMERFKEAGLNPALIYGQGTAGNATNAPVYKQGHSNYPDSLKMPEGLDFMSKIMDVKQKSANIDLTKQAVEEKRLNNELFSDTYQDRVSLAGAKVANVIANTTNANARTKMTNLLREIKEFSKDLEMRANQKEFTQYVEDDITKQNSYYIKKQKAIMEDIMNAGFTQDTGMEILMLMLNFAMSPKN